MERYLKSGNDTPVDRVTVKAEDFYRLLRMTKAENPQNINGWSESPKYLFGLDITLFSKEQLLRLTTAFGANIESFTKELDRRKALEGRRYKCP
jgi:hypothetical protein